MPFLQKINYKIKAETILDFWNGLEDNLPRSEKAKGPMERLMQYMREDRDVLVVTRGMREVRAILTGKLGGFDRFWNLVLFDVNEYSPSVVPSLKSNRGPGQKRRKRQRRIRKTEKECAHDKENVGVMERTCGSAVKKAGVMESVDDKFTEEMEVSEAGEESTSSEMISNRRATQEIGLIPQPKDIFYPAMEQSSSSVKTLKEVATQSSSLMGYDLALQPKIMSYPALYIRGANVVYVSLYTRL
ncbi:unnamed protein product [Hymenolepis diminuta]|uniref:LSM domain-containing protein n=1 Tax=Hymenolepis diminuta TaxID=6216 RepID=A0A564Z4U0_HYMDI|nr:unnamed protein product [Hymenolepis diminuta]